MRRNLPPLRSVRPPGRILPLLPALALLGWLFYGALGLSVLRSSGAVPGGDGQGQMLAAWRAVAGDPQVWRSALVSLWIAGASTLAAAVLALGIVLHLRRAPAGRGVLVALMRLNLTVPHLVGAAGMLMLWAQSGLAARLAHAMGLVGAPASFPALVWDPWAIGIILVYVWKEAPFIALVLLAQSAPADLDREDAARMLGASPLQVLRHVTLPALAPGLAAAAAIVFAFAFGAYEVPLMLGASDPVALPVLAWQRFTDPDLALRPQAMVLALMVAGLSAGAIGVHLGAVRRLREF
ncbi:MAG: ABC transporter permease subunit [Rhodobacteraceae bacterium]|nr:ABC transporter permease subunit [Paracoccaceae bacterium]